MSEIEGLQLIQKPTQAIAASNKAATLAAQVVTIAAASVGGSVFRNAATFLAANPEVKGY